MISSNLPPALAPGIHAAGDIVAGNDNWVVTTTVDVTYIYPTLPSGETIRVTHLKHIVTCHSLIHGTRVVFKRAKQNWHDSRREKVKMRRRTWFSPPEPAGRDFSSTVVSRFDVAKELARLGAGDKAQAIVDWAESRSMADFTG